MYSLGYNNDFSLTKTDDEWGIDGFIMKRHVRGAKDSKSVEFAKSVIKESLLKNVNIIKSNRALSDKRKSVRPIKLAL